MTPELDGGYRPFPTFAEWAALDVELGYVDDLTGALEEAKGQHDESRFTAAVREMSRAAAVDTNAIEGLFTTDRGFTRTVATESATWQAAAQQRGEHVLALINDAVEAYDFVLDATTSSRPVTEAWIRELHEVLCRSQETYTVHTAAGVQEQPLPKGVYKTMSNNPTSLTTGRVHHYAPPSDVSVEMNRMVGELRSEEFGEAHPVLQAAYAHYAFVCIHPFADGNGRVARALTSAYTYRRPGVPLVVYADQRDAYIDALELADAGDPHGFVDFVGQRISDVVELVRLSIAVSAATPMSQSLQRLRSASTGSIGLPHDVVDGLAARLTSLTEMESRAQLSATEMPPGASTQLDAGTYSVRALPGYRTVRQGFQIRIVQGSPANVSVGTAISTQVVLPGHDGAEFVVEAGDLTMEIRLRDIHPQESQLLHLKVETFMSGVLARLVATLSDKTEVSLRKKGYLA